MIPQEAARNPIDIGTESLRLQPIEKRLHGLGCHLMKDAQTGIAKSQEPY